VGEEEKSAADRFESGKDRTVSRIFAEIVSPVQQHFMVAPDAIRQDGHRHRGLKLQFVPSGSFAESSIPGRFRSAELVLPVLDSRSKTASLTSVGLLRRNPLRTVKTISIVNEVQPFAFRNGRNFRLVLKNSLMIRFILFLLTAPLSWP